MNEKKPHHFVYEVENWVDELTIAFLSFGTIIVAVWALFFSAERVSMLTLGPMIEPWITMVALMIIARELWILNRNIAKKHQSEGEE